MNKSTKKFKQLVLVEADNCAPEVVQLVSNKKITLEIAVAFFEKERGFDWDEDGITFVSSPIEEIKV